MNRRVAVALRKPSDRPRRSILAPFLPWTDGTGRRWRGWARLPRATPFVLFYMAISWVLYLPLADPENSYRTIDHERVSGFVYHIPDLTDNLPRFLRSLLTAVFLNHNLVQLRYVTVLLLLFGLVFEAREGTGRTMLLFFGTTLAGAIVAGVLLHVLYPDIVDNAFFTRAWNRTWSGGSAACFGLMGGLAARARRPWLLLGLFVLWEVNVAWWYLHEYTPAFHLTALLVGFLVTRCFLPPVRRHESSPQRHEGHKGTRCGL